MTTHTRANAKYQSAVALMQARHYIPLANKVYASSRYGFLRSAVDTTVMYTTRTRKNKVHVVGCARLKSTAPHAPVVTSPVGYELEDCCTNVEIATPLVHHAETIARLESLEADVNTILRTTIRSEFYRIIEIDYLTAECEQLSTQAPHPGYTAVVQGFLSQLKAAREACDLELAHQQFRVAQVARIAVGAVREDGFKNRAWRRANYEVLDALSDGGAYPFTGDLEVPGVIADILESGYTTDVVMDRARQLIELYITCGSSHRFRQKKRDLTKEDQPYIAEFLQRVRNYLDRVAQEAADPRILAGKPRVVVQTSRRGTAAEVWWARSRGVSGDRPTTLKVGALDYEWLRRREVRFCDADELAFPVRVGQRWGIAHKRASAERTAFYASQDRARDLINPVRPDAWETTQVLEHLA